jgi:hypothetical protein
MSWSSYLIEGQLRTRSLKGKRNFGRKVLAKPKQAKQLATILVESLDTRDDDTFNHIIKAEDSKPRLATECEVGALLLGTILEDKEMANDQLYRSRRTDAPVAVGGDFVSSIISKRSKKGVCYYIDHDPASHDVSRGSAPYTGTRTKQRTFFPWLDVS